MKKYQQLLLLTLVIALAIRLPLLGGSFWLDEAAQALESARPFSQQLDITPDFQPPLLHLILFAAIRISQAEWWLRLIGAVIPGLIAIASTIKLAKMSFGKKAAIVAGVLTATSSFHIFFSQELRPYSLAAMWAALSITTLYSYLQNKKPANSLKQLLLEWWPLILINILGLYSSYLYPFILIASFLVLLLLKRSLLKDYVLSAAASSVSFLPWLPSFYKQLTTGQQLRQSLPGWDQVVSHPQVQALPLTLGKFFFGVIRLDVNLVFVGVSVAIMFATLVLFAYYHQQSSAKQKDKTNFYFSLLFSIFLLLIPWLVSFWIPVIQPKRLMFVQPLIYVFLSGLIIYGWRLKRIATRVSAGALLLVLLGLNLFSSYRYYTEPSLQRENWRELVDYTEARFPTSNTVAVFGFDDAFAPWRWYAGDTFDVIAPGKIPLNSLNRVQDNLKGVYEYQFVLLFDYLRDLTDPNDYYSQAIESYGYEEIEVIDRENIGFVRVYIQDKSILVGLRD